MPYTHYFVIRCGHSCTRGTHNTKSLPRVYGGIPVGRHTGRAVDHFGCTAVKCLRSKATYKRGDLTEHLSHRPKKAVYAEGGGASNGAVNERLKRPVDTLALRKVRVVGRRRHLPALKRLDGPRRHPPQSLHQLSLHQEGLHPFNTY